MQGGNGNPGILNDAYGAFYAGGQRFFSWTNDAFNPTAWGVSTRMLPVSAPELLTSGSPNISMNQSVNPFSMKSIVPWLLIALVIGIPAYHWWEYERGGK